MAKRNAQRPAGTEVGEPRGCAAGCSERVDGARGLPVLWWCAVPVFLLPPLLHGCCVGGQKEGGGGERGGEAGGKEAAGRPQDRGDARGVVGLSFLPAGEEEEDEEEEEETSSLPSSPLLLFIDKVDVVVAQRQIPRVVQGSDNVNGCGYLHFCLHCSGFGFQARSGGVCLVERLIGWFCW